MNGVKPRLPSERQHAGPSLNSAPLLRLLAGLGVAEVAASTLSLAERWSPWLAWTDAITLSAVLDGGAPAARPGERASAWALIDQLRRLRQDLSRAIVTDLVFAAGASRTAGSVPAPAAPLPDEIALARLHRQYQAHQRAMEDGVAALRTQARAALTRRGGDLARLAALDAVLDGALAARQRRLLATVPGWLDKHARRTSAHLPAALAQLQCALLAELDMRLQPVEGMIDALTQAAGATAENSAGGPA